MNRFVRCGLLALFVFLSVQLVSAKEFLELDQLKKQAAAATREKYPDSDDVLLDDYIQVAYEADGTFERWDDTAVKVLTEKGKRGLRTLSLHFDIAYGTNYFSKVELIKPDGRVEQIDPAANSKVMVDPSQMNANIYDPKSKILKLSVAGLEVGDTVRYVAHRVRTKTIVPDTWSDYQVFEGTSPYEHTTYQVIAPKTRPLKKIALKAEVPDAVKFSRQESEQSDRIVYTWEINTVPRMFDEPNMPTRYTVVQRLLVSTLDTWEELSTWYWELCRPRLEATTPELEAKARELVADCTTTAEKIKAVFNFVSQNIRYMGITTEDEAPGYEPHDVSITFNNRYGVCRDKAALLAAMLRVVDVEAFPVIIMSGPKKDPEVPQPFFNHAVTAALGDDGEYVLMDATDENTKDIFPSYLQNMSYIVARPEGETLLTSPIIPAEDNLLKITSTGELDREGRLTATSTLQFDGINDTVYRGYFSKIKPEERKRFFEGHLKKGMPTAQLQALEILPKELRDTTQPLTIKLDYTAENLLIEGDANRMLNLPRLGGSIGYANFLIGQTGLEKRRYPMYTRMTAGVRETLQLKLSGTPGTINLPHYKAIESPQLTWNMQVAQDGAMLRGTNTFLLNTVEFSPDEYLTLKKQLKDIEYNLRKKVVIDKATQSEAVASDVRILEKSNTVVLESPSKWTETIRTKAQILTYAGKKNYSEIKLPYNPAWQQVELTRAKVTLPDGSVKEIRDEELNLMDAGWVAAAPRYPAAKLLVANLPGVEIGSVLEYEVVSKVDGKPFYSSTQLFNGHEPVDRKTVTVTAPSRMELNLLNTGIRENITESNGTIRYSWTAENQPAVKKEEALPAWWTFNPALFISTSDWKTYSRTVHAHLLAAAKDQPNTEALARELTDGLDSKRDRVLALRNWTAMNLRPAGPGLTSLPLSAISPADVTLHDRYGNNPDRMVVLYALLKAARFKPEFMLAGGLSLIPEAAEPLLKVPARSAFGAVVIKVNVDGETVYLNGESQYAELGASRFDRHRALDLRTGSIETVRVTPGKQNRTHIIYEMNLSADGEAGLTQTAFMQGTTFEGFHRTYAEITPEKRRRHYLELVSDVSQSARTASELTTDYAGYPGRIDYSVSAKGYGVQDGEYLYFTLPGGLNGMLQYRANERELPLAWNGYVDSVVEYNVVLPDGYVPAILPKTFSWQAPGGAGMIEVAVEYSPRANGVRVVQMASLRPALMPADKFEGILKAARKLAHPDMRTILLKKK